MKKSLFIIMFVISNNVFSAQQPGQVPGHQQRSLPMQIQASRTRSLSSPSVSPRQLDGSGRSPSALDSPRLSSFMKQVAEQERIKKGQDPDLYLTDRLSTTRTAGQ